MTPRLNTTIALNEIQIQSPMIQRFIITKKDKLLEVNYRIPQSNTVAQDQKLLNNFKYDIISSNKWKLV